MNTLGPGIWQEILKILENEKCTLTWNMVRKLKNMDNETQTLTWNMARNTQ
uniref:Uncharacterized protein n=1 Tax=Trichinella nativa TaxID=6335 RepID=A0A0V1KIW5_9BILA